MAAAHLDVEMICRLFRSHRFIQRDRRAITQVSLHEDDVHISLGGDAPELLHQSGGDAPAAVNLYDSEIVDINFAPILLEFVKHVCSKAADNLLVLQRDHGDEVLLIQQSLQIRIAWHRMLVGSYLAERLAEHPQQLFKAHDVRAREEPNDVSAN